MKNLELRIMNYEFVSPSLPKSPKDQAAKSWTHVRFQIRPKKKRNSLKIAPQKVAFTVYTSKDNRWLAEPRTSMFLCI